MTDQKDTLGIEKLLHMEEFVGIGKVYHTSDLDDVNSRLDEGWRVLSVYSKKERIPVQIGTKGAKFGNYYVEYAVGYEDTTTEVYLLGLPSEEHSVD